MDEFQVILQAILEKNGIEKSILDIQKIAKRIPIEMTAKLNSASTRNDIKILSKEIADNLNKSMNMNLKSKDILSAYDDMIAKSKRMAKEQENIAVFESKRANSIQGISTYLKENSTLTSKNTSEAKELYLEFERIKKEMSSLSTQDIDYKSKFSVLNNELQTAKKRVKEFGLEGRSATDEFKNMFSKFSSWFGVSQLVMFGTGKFRDSISELKEINTTLTEISKTSNKTDTELEKLGEDSFESASRYGNNANNYLVGVQEMSRAGYSNSEQMAELSTLAQSAGDMSAELANQYLIASDAAYGYNGNVEKLNELLDSQNQITNRNAVNMTELANATKIVASQASQAGVSEKNLTALLSTMIATTQQGGEIAARSLKGILMNLQQVSGEIDGEEFNEESFNKVEKRLDSVGVKMEEISNGSARLRDPIETLSELAKVYNSLPDDSVDKAGIIADLGGKYRGGQLAALLSNWDKYEKMLGDYENSSGSAFEEAMKSANNMEGTLNKLGNTWTDIIQDIADSKGIINATNLLNELLSAVNNVSSSLGSISTISGIFGAIAGFKNIGFIRTISDDVTGLNKSVGVLGLSFDEVIDKIKNVKINGFNKSTIDLSAIQKYNDLITNGTSAQEALKIASDGTNKETISLMKSTNGATVSQDALKTAMNGATVSARIASVAYKTLSVAMNIGVTLAISAGISKLIDLYDEYSNRVANAKERSEEMNEEIKSLGESINENQKWINSNSDRYEELSKGVDSLGNNIGLTSKEFEEYNKLTNEVADMFPNLVSGYSETGDAILSCKNNVDLLNQSLQAQNDEMNLKVLSNAKDTLTSVAGEVSNSVDIFGTSFGLFQKDYSLDSLINALSSGKDEFIQFKESLDSYGEQALESVLNDANLSNLINGTYEDYVKGFDQIKAYQSKITTEVNAETSKITPIANALLYFNRDYKSFDDEQLKSSISKVINGLDFDFYNTNMGLPLLDDPDEMKDRLSSVVNQFVQNVKSDSKLQEALNGLFSPSYPNISASEYVSAMNTYIDEVAKSMNIDKKSFTSMFKLDDLSSIQNDFNTAIRKISSKSGKFGIAAVVDSDKTQREIKDWINKLDKDDLKIVASLDIDKYSGIESLKTALNEIKNQTNQTDNIKINPFSDEDFSSEASKFEKNINTIQDSFSRLSNGEQFGNSEILSLIEQFGLDSSVATQSIEGLTHELENAANVELDSIINSLNALKDKIPLEQYESLVAAFTELKNQAIGFSNSYDVDGAVNDLSYLNGILDSVKNKQTLSAEEVAKLIGKYSELAGAVIDVNNGYLIENDALTGVINKQIESANTGISSEINKTKQTIESTKLRIQAMSMEMASLATLQSAYNRVSNNSTNPFALVTKGKQAVSNEVIKEKNNNIAKEQSNLSDLQSHLKSLYSSLGSVGSSKVTSVGKSNGKSGSGSSNKSFDKVYDNIKTKIENIQSTIDLTQSSITDFSSDKSEQTAYKNIKNYYDKQIDAYKSGKKYYQNKMKKIKFSKKERDTLNKVVDGDISITSVKNETLSKKIDSYKDYFDKAKEFTKNITDVQTKFKESEIDIIQVDVDKLNNDLKKLETRKSNLQSELDNKNSRQQQDIYQELINTEQDEIYKNNALLVSLNKQLSLVKNKSSDKYIELSNTITDTKTAIDECVNSQQEFNKSINELNISDIEKKIELYGTVKDLINARQDLKTQKGERLSNSDYSSLLDVNLEQMRGINKNRAKYESNAIKAINSKNGLFDSLTSEEWYAKANQQRVEYSSLQKENEELKEKQRTLEATNKQIEIDKLQHERDILQDNISYKGDSVSKEDFENINNIIQKLEISKKLQNDIWIVERNRYEDGSDKWNEYNDLIEDNNSSIRELTASQKENNATILSLNTRQYEKQKKAIEETIGSLERQKELLQENLNLLNYTKDDYSSSLSAVNNVLDDAIKKEQEKLDLIDKQNDAAQRAYDLEMAKLNLNKAKGDKSKFIMSDGSEVYKADLNAIRDAENELQNLQREEEKYKIQESIDKIEDYKDRFNQSIDKAQNESDETKASQVLGELWKSAVLNLDEVILQGFSNLYYNNEKQIIDYTDKIENIDKIIESENSKLSSIDDKIEKIENVVESFKNLEVTYEEGTNKINSIKIAGSYKNGTRNAIGGISRVSENDKWEMLKTSSGSLIPLNPADQIFDNKKSENLWKWASTTPNLMLQNLSKNLILPNNTNQNNKSIKVQFGNLYLGNINNPETFTASVIPMIENSLTQINI